LRRIRQDYPDANHHCFAYKLGSAVRFSDDGEPGGTAGRPMLEVLTKRNLDYVLAVVTRYFGGTKLGAGGLVRAYSGALARALDEAGVMQVRDRLTLVVDVPFAEMSTAHWFIDGFNGVQKEKLEYLEQGMILKVSLFADDEADFKSELKALTRGKVKYL
jgi:putative IMPACT (imprinted ancient) family translation regulator